MSSAVRWQCIVEGRAAHSSRPELGANAVSAMAQVVQTIDEYQRSELSHRTTDPLCGGPSACVTTIRGGTGANTVPDRAAIDVDRRLSPEEAPDAAYRELIDYLEQHCDVAPCRILHEPPWMQSLGMRSSDQRWSQQVAAAVQSFGRPGRLVGVPYGTNAASIAAAGIPTVVLGPGSIDQAHTADEWIAVEELEAAVEVYERIAV